MARKTSACAPSKWWTKAKPGLLALLLLAGCARFQARYDLALETAGPGLEFLAEAPPAQSGSRQENGETLLFFEDALLRAEFLLEKTGIRFSLRNKSSRSLVLPWARARFIDRKGLEHPLLHQGIPFAQRHLRPAPVYVVPGETWQTRLVPASYVYFDQLSQQWQVSRILPNWPVSGQTLAELETQVAPFRHMPLFQLQLPLIVANQLKEYRFAFRIEEVEVSDGS